MSVWLLQQAGTEMANPKLLGGDRRAHDPLENLSQSEGPLPPQEIGLIYGLSGQSFK